MTTWNQNQGFYPPPDSNQEYYAGQPGYPSQQPYPGAMPPQGPMSHQDLSGKTEINRINDTSHGMYEDVEGDVKGFDFSNRSIRHGFIRKVYAILMIQLTITMGFIVLFLYHQPTKHYIQQHEGLWWISLIITFVCLLIMACCEYVRRKTPLNFIFLTLFTLAESFMLGMAASFYDESAVLMAVGITATVCLALTLFAFQTKSDFTIIAGAVLVLTVVSLICGIVTIFVRYKISTYVYASLGALLFSLYLIIDTQMMIDDAHEYSISPEEYIFAALSLYSDITNIFLYILSIILESDN